MKHTLSLVAAILLAAISVIASDVTFETYDAYGDLQQSNNVTLTLLGAPVSYNGAAAYSPPQVHVWTNGSLTIPLVGGKWLAAFAGQPKQYVLNVPSDSDPYLWTDLVETNLGAYKKLNEIFAYWPHALDQWAAMNPNLVVTNYVATNAPSTFDADRRTLFFDARDFTTSVSNLSASLGTAAFKSANAFKAEDTGGESIPANIQTNLPTVGDHTYCWTPNLVYDSHRRQLYSFRSVAYMHGGTNDNMFVLNISTDNGVTWGDSTVLQSSDEFSLMNVSAGMGKDGRVCVLFGKLRLTDKNETTWAMYSDDGCKTFSAPALVSVSSTVFGAMIPFGKITSAGNTLYCGAYGTGQGSSGVEGLLLRSKDNGATWGSLSIGSHNVVSMMYDEPAVAVRNEQELLAICRGSNGWNAFWTTNGGASFTNLGTVFSRSPDGSVVSGLSYNYPVDIFSAKVGGNEKILMLAGVRSSAPGIYYSEINWDDLPNVDNFSWNMTTIGNLPFTASGTLGNYTGGYPNGVLMPDGTLLVGYAYDFSTDTANLTNCESRFATYRPTFTSDTKAVKSKYVFAGGGDFRSLLGPSVYIDPRRMGGYWNTNYRGSALRIHGDQYNYIDYNLFAGASSFGYYNLINTNDVGWRTTYNQSTYSLYYKTPFPGAFNQSTLTEAFRIASSTGFGLEVPSGVTTTAGGVTNNSAQPIVSAGGFVGSGFGVTNVFTHQGAAYRIDATSYNVPVSGAPYAAFTSYAGGVAALEYFASATTIKNMWFNYSVTNLVMMLYTNSSTASIGAYTGYSVTNLSFPSSGIGINPAAFTIPAGTYACWHIGYTAGVPSGAANVVSSRDQSN